MPKDTSYCPARQRVLLHVETILQEWGFLTRDVACLGPEDADWRDDILMALNALDDLTSGDDLAKDADRAMGDEGPPYAPDGSRFHAIGISAGRTM